jgi:putative glutamine amidotransferase
MKKSHLRLISVIIILAGLALWTCQSDRNTSVYVAVSKYRDTATWENYKNWLQQMNPDFVLVDMYHLPLDSALMMLERCSGLLMSGGADVHPAFYGQAADTILCEIDYYRDTVEMAILQRAGELGMPVFGICRGLQILNVFYGGSLYPDIPERFSRSVNHRSADRSFDLMHPLTVVPKSELHQLTGITDTEVNSSHHQGIDRLAPGLIATAHSPDTLIEAIERANPDGHPFMMAVQWHPERLPKDHPMSYPLAKRFTEEIMTYHRSAHIQKR